MTMKTRSGLVVLAKEYKGITMPKTFANLRQANAAKDALIAQGIAAHVTARWPFLVVVENS